MAEIPIQSLQESSGDAVGQVTRSRDPVADVAKLLSQEPAPAEPSPETGDQAAPTSESWDLKSVAEKLQTDPAKLYEGLKVALEDGTELTVSALKDAYRPAAEVEKARKALLEENTSSKREVLEATQELRALLAEIPAQYLTEQTIAQARAAAGRERDREAAKLLEAVPEWKDPIARAADWSDIRRVAKEVGYSDAEIRLAEDGFADHRLVAVLRRLARGPKAEAVKPAPKVAAKPAGGNRTPAQQFGQLKAAVKTGRVSPFTAVEQLIRSK
jgi:hypothetical protein